MLIGLLNILKGHLNILIDSVKQGPLVNDQILQFLVDRIERMDRLDDFHDLLVPLF